VSFLPGFDGFVLFVVRYLTTENAEQAQKSQRDINKLTLNLLFQREGLLNTKFWTYKPLLFLREGVWG